MIDCAAVEKIEDWRKPDDFSGTASGTADLMLYNSNRQNKCPKTLGNKGLSGIYAISKNAAATLSQHAMEKV